MKGKRMKYIRLAVLSLAFLGASLSLVHAQGAGVEWRILNQEATELYNAGKYDRAVLVAQKALEVAEQNVGPDHPDVAMSLNNLALLYDTQGDYAKAEPLYKRSLAIWEKTLGPNHPNVAESLVNLAALYRATKRDAEAEALEQRAANILAIRR
jgi:tetratricopeptide (TPR) repeat protein